MDYWVYLSGLWGVVLPFLIEIFSKNVTGQKKILCVFGSCLFSAFILHGVDGGFVGWNWGKFAGSFLIILVMSVNLWKQMWKQWFPKDPDPIEGHQQEIIKSELNK